MYDRQRDRSVNLKGKWPKRKTEQICIQ